MLVRHSAEWQTIDHHLTNRLTLVCQLAEWRTTVCDINCFIRPHTNICSHKIGAVV
jgi:hypothetical protein